MRMLRILIRDIRIIIIPHNNIMQNSTKRLPSATIGGWYKKWWGILLIIIIGFILAVLTAIIIFLTANIKKIMNQPSDPGANIESVGLDPRTTALITGGDKNYWIGAADPKVTIVEFGDFACLYCQKSFSTIREIGLKYPNHVKIIFRDYPIISEYSAALALAARCAGEQGLFWVMHDKLFLNQDVTKPADIAELAKQIGADVNRFNYCVEHNRYLSSVQKDFADGRELDITGTPAWFINGYKVEGDIPPDIFMQIIEKLIN